MPWTAVGSSPLAYVLLSQVLQQPTMVLTGEQVYRVESSFMWWMICVGLIQLIAIVLLIPLLVGWLSTPQEGGLGGGGGGQVRFFIFPAPLACVLVFLSSSSSSSSPPSSSPLRSAHCALCCIGAANSCGRCSWGSTTAACTAGAHHGAHQSLDQLFLHFS